MALPLSSSAARPVMTVQGPVPFESLGVADAHNHMWIDPIPGADPNAPILNQFDSILKELIEYREKGGGTLLDCQPGGCGRNGNQLLALSIASSVNIIACTGFHRKKYYSQDCWLWKADAEKICDFLCSELNQGLLETLETSSPVRAGFIKIALESAWADCTPAALEGAASAALKSKALMEIHTEKGALAEKACVYFTDVGLSPSQLVLCHMDKKAGCLSPQRTCAAGCITGIRHILQTQIRAVRQPLAANRKNGRRRIFGPRRACHRYGRGRALSLPWGWRWSGKSARRDTETTHRKRIPGDSSKADAGR